MAGVILRVQFGSGEKLEAEQFTVPFIRLMKIWVEAWLMKTVVRFPRVSIKRGRAAPRRRAAQVPINSRNRSKDVA